MWATVQHTKGPGGWEQAQGGEVIGTWLFRGTLKIYMSNIENYVDTKFKADKNPYKKVWYIFIVGPKLGGLQDLQINRISDIKDGVTFSHHNIV